MRVRGASRKVTLASVDTFSLPPARLSRVMGRRMADPDRIRLHFGPYHPPRCRVDEVLTCAVRGRVKVVGFFSGRIPWPVTFVGNRGPSLIVCGGLLRAVHRESRPAVADWWGVRVLTVSIWRRALKNPEYRARLVNAKRLANLRAANRRRLRTRPRRVPLWKPEWDVLLGSEPDRKLAERLGVNRQLVFSRRKLLGIAGTRPRPAHRVRRWKPWEDALLGTGPDREIAERLGCGLRAVFFRRQKLGVPAFRQRQPDAQDVALPFSFGSLGRPTPRMGASFSCLRAWMRVK